MNSIPSFDNLQQNSGPEYSQHIPGNQQLDRKSILIAGDNCELWKVIIQDLLESYKVIECSGGFEAWERILETMPDIVVSDVSIGELNGLELCRNLKNDERTSHIPVILLAGMVSEDNKIESLLAQADQYIIKPFEIKELALKVKNLLALREAIQKKIQMPLPRPDFFDSKAKSRDDVFILQMISIIEQNMSDPSFGVVQISKSIGISRSVIYRRLKTITGMSIKEFSKSVRLKKAADILLTDTYTINEIAELVGFNDRRYFSREFTKLFNKKPSEYARSAFRHEGGRRLTDWKI